MRKEQEILSVNKHNQVQQEVSNKFLLSQTVISIQKEDSFLKSFAFKDSLKFMDEYVIYLSFPYENQWVGKNNPWILEKSNGKIFLNRDRIQTCMKISER